MPTEQQIQIWGIVLQIIVILGSVAVGFYKFNELISKKINDQGKEFDGKIKRIYERQDEKFEEVEKNYVSQSVHDIEIKYLNEKNEEKFNSTIKLFDTKLESLASAVRDLITRLNHTTGQ